jgi:hypothetical protein
MDAELAERARLLGINVSAAAREGVAAAIRHMLEEMDRRAYEMHPESQHDDWASAEEWGDA